MRQHTKHATRLTNLKYVFILLLVVSCWSLASTQVSAQQTPYPLLAPLPLDGTGRDTDVTTANKYIEGMFVLVIAVAGALAVLMIIFGGIKYMSTDAFSGKSEAKETIKNALVGLLLAISAYTILATINDKLLSFNLALPTIQRTPTPPAQGGGGGGAGAVTNPGGGSPSFPAICIRCVTVGVSHKIAPHGCAPPGPCQVDPSLNSKLVALNKITAYLVTEAYPPTRPHTDACHNNGTCVDATIIASNPANIKKFIDDAKSVGLRAEFEVKTLAKAQEIRRVTGLSESQVRVRPEISGEHFSVYLN